MSKRKKLGRPRLPKNEVKQMVALRLPIDLIDRIEAKADRTGKNRSEVMEHTLENYLDFAVGGI